MNTETDAVIDVEIEDTVTPEDTPQDAPRARKLTRMQRIVVGVTIAPMVAVGVAGGIGTYSNISGKYGSGTAVGALAAGEGATAVAALVLLVTTLLGQSAPALVRVALWALPAAAAVMGATAGHGTGEIVVYSLTPMAITASAEGIAFLSRRVVVYGAGRDIEAEARAAGIVRALAYHHARAAAHPEEKARKRSVKKSWKLAAKVGRGDTRLGTELLDVQLARITGGADAALAGMFQPGMTATVAPALSAASADIRPALPPVSTDDATNSRAHESTIRPDANGYPVDMGSDQAEESESVRPDLKILQGEKKAKPSIAADVRDMVRGGIDDVRLVAEALATRHGREADDPTFKGTVARSFRAAKAASAPVPVDTAPDEPSPYL
ncbi:conjugal transfer protein [Streptomyces sp. NPDC057575]|uniref:conjugal transfer protein n=1 Tax=unclassified Streptomyces TaxID=2593676 RepID=UPI0036A6FEB4